MASWIEIANAALVRMGYGTTLTALDEDTKAARTISAVMFMERDAELRAHPWNFAWRRASLPALTIAPAFGYTHQYQLPADWLRFVKPDDISREWAIEGGLILANEAGPLNIHYVRRVDEPGLFDPQFAIVLACRVAMTACEELTGSAAKKQAISQELREARAEARRIDGQENPPEDRAESDWLLSREAP